LHCFFSTIVQHRDPQNAPLASFAYLSNLRIGVMS